jgi:outer membrane protein assembly factor BamB
LRFSAYVLAGLSPLLVARAPDDTAPWPQANGPHGNFNPRRYGHKLVDDLKDARQVWVSEDRDLGFAKGSASGYVNHLTAVDTHPGSASGLIVAEGKVFAATYRPSGEAWAERAVIIERALQSGKFTPAQVEAIKRNAAIDADDLVIAYDLKTGKVAWKGEEKGRGLNRYSGKRNHFGVTPAYHDGRVFSLGTAGVLYAYEAATGKKLWEDATGLLAREMPAAREELLRKRDKLPGGGGMSASLVVADGVLVVPQFSAKEPRTVALRGVEAATGKTLWEVSDATCRYATPAVWRHGERQYVLAANTGAPGKHDSAKMRLIDPKEGKTLWTVDGLSPTWYPLAPSETHVFVNVPSKAVNPKKEKDKEPWGLMAAFRLSPGKAERAWTMPDEPPFRFENHFDSCCMRRVLARDGLVYFFSQGHTVDPARASRFFSILKEETGEALLTTKDGEVKIGQCWLVEDRLLNIPDAAHSDRATVELFTADPSGFKRLCEAWKPPQQTSTAYEVFLELPYVDGLFLMRTQTGQVACYDLRAR